MNVGRIQKNRKSEAEYPGGGKQQANRESLVHSNFEMTLLNCWYSVGHSILNIWTRESRVINRALLGLLKTQQKKKVV